MLIKKDKHPGFLLEIAVRGDCSIAAEIWMGKRNNLHGREGEGRGRACSGCTGGD